MRSHRATNNLLVVSANVAEPSLNTPQTLDTSMLADVTDIIDIDPRREDNADELNGLEEAGTIYDLGTLATGTFRPPRGQPQHFAFVFAYALGRCQSAAAGDGYQHTITPIPEDLDAQRSNPSFTAAMRYGKTVMKRRFLSMFIDSFTATFTADDWCRIQADLKGTGKTDINTLEETITAADNATALTLSENAVAGTTPQNRIDNVQRIRAALTGGVYTEVTHTGVSDDIPAVITITPPGSTGASVPYKVLYIPEETGWMNFPNRIAESPLRVSEVNVTLDGTWNGSTFSGGRNIDAEVRSVEWRFENHMEIEFLPGAGGAYASRAFRPSRTQRLVLDEEFRSAILPQYIRTNETFGMRIRAEGAEYDPPHRFEVDIVFPKLAVVSAPVRVDGKRLVEKGDFAVLEDDTHGSVIVRIKNLQPSYAS
jgi:hypothetical protein